VDRFGRILYCVILHNTVFYSYNYVKLLIAFGAHSSFTGHTNACGEERPKSNTVVGAFDLDEPIVTFQTVDSG